MAGLDVGQRDDIEMDPVDDTRVTEETDFGGGHDDSSRFEHFNRTLPSNYPDYEYKDDELSKIHKQDLTEEKYIKTKKFFKKVYNNIQFDKVYVTEHKKNFWVSLARKSGTWFIVNEDGIQDRHDKKQKPSNKLIEALGEKRLDVIDTTFNDLQMENDKIKKKLEEEKNNSDHIERLKKQNKIKDDIIKNFVKENKNLRKALDESTSPQEREEIRKKMKENNKKNEELEKEKRESSGTILELNERNRELTEHVNEGENQQRLRGRMDEILKKWVELEEERNEIISNLSLTGKVKYYLKKYGFTIIGITASIASVIASIVAYLSSGVSALADGMKELGKKVAQILPGMAGAIAGFIFNIAASVVGFLAHNSWLLILFAVTFVIEQYTKKK